MKAGNHPLVLLGFMGSGKSSVARVLAGLLQLPLIDLDARIEARCGCSIAEFFAREGEAAFRQIESEELARALAEDAVISTGGGIIAQERNRRKLQDAQQEPRYARIVYLRATPHTLAKRIRLSPGTRPLIDGDGELDTDATRRRVEELLSTRAPLYEECATNIVDTDDLSLHQVARQIAEIMRNLSSIV